MAFIRNYLHDLVQPPSESTQPMDKKLWIVCVTAALSLSIIHYANQYDWWFDFLAVFLSPAQLNALMDAYLTGYWSRLIQLLHWSFVSISGYVIIPWLVIRFILKEKVIHFGLITGIQKEEVRVYGLTLLVMIPLVFLVSHMSSFQSRYPFYQSVDGIADQRLWIWECAYLLQFFALEFFFRGFVVHGIKHRFGILSVFVMMIPYCMIHFGKPFPETIAAILAGIFLGLVSLRTNSIWLGVLLHCSVAITMDLLALWQKGLIG
ncbi:MAG: type II CAAX prenyl endopeptidase Rce1 family protein [Ferruginibacter sp.]